MTSTPDLNRFRAAIPEQYLRIDPQLAWAHLVRDLSLCGALCLLRAWLPPWHSVDPLSISVNLAWTFALGTTFVALFVVGHDCIHGTFSRNQTINTIIGHLALAPLLLPFWGTRAVHLNHHRYTNHVDRDTQYRPRRLAELADPPFRTLYGGEPGRGRAFDPRDEAPQQGVRKLTSVVSLVLFLALTRVVCGSWGGWLFLFWVPWGIGTLWTNTITWLHHTHAESRCFDDGTWSFVPAQLGTVDRSLGWLFDVWMHHPGYHLAEHLFPSRIPHYHWKSASQAIYHLAPGHFTHSSLLRSLFHIHARCHHVEPAGDHYAWRPAPTSGERT